MNRVATLALKGLRRVGTQYLPFADAASTELPLARLFRLSLFQVSVGMSMALLAGTLNRVMILELHVPASLVALMVSLPLLVAPFRALIGYRSDTHVSVLGWRRVPYLWFGTLLQFGGLSIMPFALILLNGDKDGSLLPGRIGAALAFLLVGLGAHTVQTAGMALATDLAPPEKRPRVVALLYLMLLVGMLASGVGLGTVLLDFSNTRLVGVVQGAAMLTAALNIAALWKQEPRDASRAVPPEEPVPAFGDVWRDFVAGGRAARLLLAVGLGAAGFSMQDILLEPYGGQVLHLGVGQTTQLTAMMAAGAIVAFVLAARLLEGGSDALRLSAIGAVAGILALAAIIFSSPIGSPALFRLGTTVLGFGSGLFSVGTLTAAMGLDQRHGNGLAIGAWGAVQATATGLALATGGGVRDLVGRLAESGALGPVLRDPAVGYSAVYHLEILLLFAAMAAVGPLAAPAGAPRVRQSFGLAELPG